MKDVMGVIPARGGSRSIPHKNIAPLMGRPLLAYTCEAALSSQRLGRVIVSTDDPLIARVAEECGVEAPFIRPAELSRDETPTLPVIQHAVRWLNDRDAYNAEAIMILQPTSPLREAGHIDSAIGIMEKTRADTVVSVTEVPHRYNPASVMTLMEDGRLRAYAQGPMILRRQDKPVVYARNGPSILLVRTETLMNQDTLYGENTLPLFMREIESFDVDGPDDLFLVEAILKHSQSRGEAGAVI